MYVWKCLCIGYRNCHKTHIEYFTATTTIEIWMVSIQWPKIVWMKEVYRVGYGGYFLHIYFSSFKYDSPFSFSSIWIYVYNNSTQPFRFIDFFPFCCCCSCCSSTSHSPRFSLVASFNNDDINNMPSYHESTIMLFFRACLRFRYANRQVCMRVHVSVSVSV